MSGGAEEKGVTPVIIELQLLKSMQGIKEYRHLAGEGGWPQSQLTAGRKAKRATGPKRWVSLCLRTVTELISYSSPLHHIWVVLFFSPGHLQLGLFALGVDAYLRSDCSGIGISTFCGGRNGLNIIEMQAVIVSPNWFGRSGICSSLPRRKGSVQGVTSLLQRICVLCLSPPCYVSSGQVSWYAYVLICPVGWWPPRSGSEMIVQYFIVFLNLVNLSTMLPTL